MFARFKMATPHLIYLHIYGMTKKKCISSMVISFKQQRSINSCYVSVSDIYIFIMKLSTDQRDVFAFYLIFAEVKRAMSVNHQRVSTLPHGQCNHFYVLHYIYNLYALSTNSLLIVMTNEIRQKASLRNIKE